MIARKWRRRDRADCVGACELLTSVFFIVLALRSCRTVERRAAKAGRYEGNSQFDGVTQATANSTVSALLANGGEFDAIGCLLCGKALQYFQRGRVKDVGLVVDHRADVELVIKRIDGERACAGAEIVARGSENFAAGGIDFPNA
jgi:hypothetical protein